MNRNFALFSILLITLALSSCQTSSIDVPDLQKEPVRKAPVNVLNEFIAPLALEPLAIDIESGNLFDNGGFESGLTNWGACDTTAIELSNDANEGTKALKVNAGKCFYRSAEVSPEQDLVLSCYTKILSGSGWTGMGMGFADENWAELSQAPIAIVSGTSYARFDSRATAPANAKYVSMWFYTDNPVVVDDCSLMLEEEPPVPPSTGGNLLENSTFENATTNSVADWNLGCGGTLTANTNAIALQGSACLDQGLSAIDIAALAGKNYTYSCRVNNLSDYASMSIFLDGALESKVLPPTQGYLTVELSRTAPTQLSNGFVSIYSEGTLNVESCSLTIEGTPEPEVDNLLLNGGFDSANSDWNTCSANALNIANGSLTVSNGDCIYQTVPAVSGGSYQLKCEARSLQTGWNNIILDFLDANWQSTGNKSYILVRNQDLRDYAINLNTPNNAAHVAVSFYTEGQISIDTCSLKQGTVLPEDTNNLLENGSFEAGSVGPSANCTHSYTSAASKVRSGTQAIEFTNSSDCLEYTFTGLTPGSYQLSCYYQVQSALLLSGPSAEWGYRWFYQAGSEGAGLLLAIDQLDTYRLKTIGANVNQTGRVTFKFSGQGLLFDDCSFTAQ